MARKAVHSIKSKTDSRFLITFIVFLTKGMEPIASGDILNMLSVALNERYRTIEVPQWFKNSAQLMKAQYF